MHYGQDCSGRHLIPSPLPRTKFQYSCSTKHSLVLSIISDSFFPFSSLKNKFKTCQMLVFDYLSERSTYPCSTENFSSTTDSYNFVVQYKFPVQGNITKKSTTIYQQNRPG